MTTGEKVVLSFEPIGDHWRRGGCKVSGWQGHSVHVHDSSGVKFAAKTFLHDFGAFYCGVSLDSRFQNTFDVECFVGELYGLQERMYWGPTLFIKCVKLTSEYLLCDREQRRSFDFVF